MEKNRIMRKTLTKDGLALIKKRIEELDEISLDDLEKLKETIDQKIARGKEALEKQNSPDKNETNRIIKSEKIDIEEAEIMIEEHIVDLDEEQLKILEKCEKAHQKREEFKKVNSSKSKQQQKPQILINEVLLKQKRQRLAELVEMAEITEDQFREMEELNAEINGVPTSHEKSDVIKSITKQDTVHDEKKFAKKRKRELEQRHKELNEDELNELKYFKIAKILEKRKKVNEYQREYYMKRKQILESQKDRISELQARRHVLDESEMKELEHYSSLPLQRNNNSSRMHFNKNLTRASVLDEEYSDVIEIPSSLLHNLSAQLTSTNAENLCALKCLITELESDNIGGDGINILYQIKIHSNQPNEELYGNVRVPHSLMSNLRRNLSGTKHQNLCTLNYLIGEMQKIDSKQNMEHIEGEILEDLIVEEREEDFEVLFQHENSVKTEWDSTIVEEEEGSVYEEVVLENEIDVKNYQ